MKKTFHSNGKLLLTGEYVVLDGALALAIPTKYGQSLEINTTEENGISWKSYDEKGAIWFEGNFEIIDGIINSKITSEGSQKDIQEQLIKILRAAKKLNPAFLTKDIGLEIKTKLDFPRNWGLGTSSTLINNIAKWAEIDAFILLANSFGGSGYDIAAAQSDSPILYNLKQGKPSFRKASLSWEFTDSLFFVHLNQKQDSKEGIKRYRQATISEKDIQNISDLTNKILESNSLSEFESLINSHEQLISKIIDLPTIKEELFSDFNGVIKSLGAWGGDLVLATGTELDMDYFRSKGYNTVVSYSEMIK